MDDTAVSASRLPTGHPVVDHGRIGVLIVNLGTPEAATYWPVRRYLKEFLSDPRVIETQPGPVVGHPEWRDPDLPAVAERS